MMGPFLYCLAIQAHGQLPDEISPAVCCRWTSNEVQSWTFSHTDGTYIYYSDLLEINKNNMNEGHF